MKRVLAILVLCVVLLAGCGQGVGSIVQVSSLPLLSTMSKQEIVSEIDAWVKSKAFEPEESSSAAVPKDISLLAGLPYTAEGKIDFEKIAHGFNIVYSWDINYNGDFKYKRAFNIVEYFGVYDFTGHVKSQIELYFDDNAWCITLPADAVDEYVLSKFDVVIDRSLIEEYDPETETYLIYPFAGEYYYETEVLSSKALENGQYEFFILTTEDQLNEEGTPVQSWVQRFVIDCTGDDYKYVSVNVTETYTR